MKKAIICDIDGCLLNTEKVFEEILRKKLKGNDKWDYFHKQANNPSLVSKNRKLFDMLNNYKKLNYQVILLTARSMEIYSDTYHYLTQGEGVNLEIPLLLMRKLDDRRPAYIVKQEILNELQKEYYIELAIDDEAENCEMFKRNGILTLKVV